MAIQQYMTPDGRFWWIDEVHPITDDRVAVCREVNTHNGHTYLGHTAIISRKLLAHEV